MKCPLCNSRKGKRKCLITEGNICSLCCGQSRKEATCQGCVFYQEQRPTRKYNEVPSYTTKQMESSDELQGYSFTIERAIFDFDQATHCIMKDPDAITIIERLIDKYYFKDETLRFEDALIEKGFNFVQKAMEDNHFANIPEDIVVKVLGVLRFVARRRTTGKREYLKIIEEYIGPFMRIPKSRH